VSPLTEQIFTVTTSLDDRLDDEPLYENPPPLPSCSTCDKELNPARLQNVVDLRETNQHNSREDLQARGNIEKDMLDGSLATESSSIEEQPTLNCISPATSVNEHTAALMSNTKIFPLNDSIDLDCAHHNLEETFNLVSDSTTPNRPSSADILETNTYIPTQPTLAAAETTTEEHPETSTHQHSRKYSNPLLIEETTCNVFWILSHEQMMLPSSPPPRANQPTGDPGHHTRATNTQQRKSARLADKAKNNVGLGNLQLAQQVLVKKLGELIPNSQQKFDCNFDSLVQQLPRPFNKATMEALQVLLEEGNKAKSKKKSKAKSKKKSKVAPAPTMDQPLLAV
jgi:hypothetical protein